jgi:hypothetical protein
MDGLLKTLFQKSLNEVVEKVPRCLFETIERATEVEDMIWLGAKPAGLVDVNFFIIWEKSMDEGGSDVTLCRSKA